MKIRRKWLAVAMGIGGVGLGVGIPATAQDIRISVTGSNIKRVDAETAAPVQTLTREDIQASGLQTIQDVVRQITANNNGSISPSFTNGFSASGTAVSLRGLGPNNTLVLVNGRRMANFGLADDGHISYVDLSQIPFDAVERIEVLKDGASAIYGSDAVAGVINVILRQQFTGFTVTGTAGTSYNGEGNQYKAAITAGIGDLTKDRYNAYVTFDYQKQDAYPMNKGRQYVGTNDLRFMGLPDARAGNPESGFFQWGLLSNVAPVDASDPNGTAGRLPVAAGRVRPGEPRRRILPLGLQGLHRHPAVDRAHQRARARHVQRHGRDPGVHGAFLVRGEELPARSAELDARILARPFHREHPVDGQRLPARRPSGQPVLGEQRSRPSLVRRRRAWRHGDAVHDGHAALSAGAEGCELGLGLGRRRPVHPHDDRHHHQQRLPIRPVPCRIGRHRPVRVLPDRRGRTAERSRDLRLDRARPLVQDDVGKHDRRRQGVARPLQARRRAAGVGGRLRVSPRGVEQSGSAGGGHRERRGREQFQGIRRAQRQCALRRVLCADPFEPRSHGRDPLRPLLGRRQHVEPEDRRQVGRRPVAGPARHVADGLSRPGPLRDEHRQRLRRAAGRRRSGALPGHAIGGRLPGLCPGRHHRQSLHPSGNVDDLYARRDLGTDPGLERHARLLEHRGQGPDHHREPAGHRQQS